MSRNCFNINRKEFARKSFNGPTSFQNTFLLPVLLAIFLCSLSLALSLSLSFSLSLSHTLSLAYTHPLELNDGIDDGGIGTAAAAVRPMTHR